MAVMIAERTVEEITVGEIIARLRDGEDGPGGALFSHRYSVQEITATGGGGGCGFFTSTTSTLVSHPDNPCSAHAFDCCP